MDPDCEYDFFDDCTDSGNESHELYESEDDLEFEMDLDFIEQQSDVSCQKIEDEYYYEALSTEDIMKHMVENINEVNNVTQIPETTTRILLHHFKWDKEKLIDRFYSENQEEMFKKAQVISPCKSAKNAEKRSSIRPGSGSITMQDCEICCLTFPLQILTGLACDHFYCNQCWTEYLTTKIMDEGASQMIECPGCNIVVDDQKVMNIIIDPMVKEKYQHLITNSFVQCNKLIRWCPSPNCTNAIKVQHVEARLVKCKCSHEFCFRCTENWHEPVSCKLIKKWKLKCQDDSETNNWLIVNTKQCPKCSATIEKNGGCNHMTCKACKADFCWLCLVEWSSHNICNSYNEEESMTKATTRLTLKKYLFYYSRYLNHHQSFKLEKTLNSMVKNKMEEMMKHNMSWIDVQFLKKSLDTLFECRRTLMYTYAFAHYLKKNNHSTMFEDNQKDLESATEQLSEYLERDIDDENLFDIKLKVLDKYKYCDSRRKILLAYVHEGYEKDWWEYTEEI